MDEGLIDAIDRIARALPRQQVESLARVIEPHERPSAIVRAGALGAVPTGAFADLTGRLFDAWSNSDDVVGGAGLAVALMAAVRSVGIERNQEAVEIVWTGPRTNQVPVRLTREALLEVVRAATRELFVVSFAAYKVEEVVDELRQAADRGIKIRLILESAKVDGGTLTFGAAAAFGDLRQRASFYVWPLEKRPVVDSGRAALHAKAAIADDHTALVTSANLTGFAIKENMELGVLIRGGPVPARLAAHFRELIASRKLEEIIP